jgi:hypothetical protein
MAHHTGWSPPNGADDTGTNDTISSGYPSPPDPKKSRTAMAVIPGTEPVYDHTPHPRARQTSSVASSSRSVAQSEARLRVAEAEHAVALSQLELQRQRFNLQVLQTGGSRSRSGVGSASASDVDSVVGTHVTSVSCNQHQGSLSRAHDVLQGVATGGSSSSTSRPAANSVVAAVPALVLTGRVEKSTYPIFKGVEKSTPEDMIRQQIVVGEKLPRLLADKR